MKTQVHLSDKRQNEVLRKIKRYVGLIFIGERSKEVIRHYKITGVAPGNLKQRGPLFVISKYDPVRQRSFGMCEYWYYTRIESLFTQFEAEISNWD